jgi:hypothetical protein
MKTSKGLSPSMLLILQFNDSCKIEGLATAVSAGLQA